MKLKRNLKQELQRIYHATYTEEDFIPEVNDALDREKFMRNLLSLLNLA